MSCANGVRREGGRGIWNLHTCLFFFRRNIGIIIAKSARVVAKEKLTGVSSCLNIILISTDWYLMTGAGTLYLYTLSYFLPIESVLQKEERKGETKRWLLILTQTYWAPFCSHFLLALLLTVAWTKRKACVCVLFAYCGALVRCVVLC